MACIFPSVRVLCMCLSLLASTCFARELQGLQSEPLLGPPTYYDEGTAAPTSTAPGTVSAQQTTPALYSKIVELHNQHRRDHGAGPLSWDADLAAAAATWAAGCTWQHTPASDRFVNGQPYGQNLFAVTRGGNNAYCQPPWPSCTDESQGNLIWAIEAWYAEVTNWDFQNSKPKYDDYMTNQDHMVGHFTQVVWKATSRIGCAVHTCPTLANTGGMTNADYVVCDYQSAGNVQGQFAANVLPLNTPVSPSPPSSPSPLPPSSPSPLPVESPQPPGEPITPGNSLETGERALKGANCLVSDNQIYKLCVSPYGDLIVTRTPDPVTGRTNVWRSMMTLGPSPTNPASEGQYSLVVDNDHLAIKNKYGEEVLTVRATFADNLPIKLVMRDNGKVGVFDANNKCLFGFGTPVGTEGGC